MTCVHETTCMNSVLQDFRFALRVLAKAPVFTIAAVAVLALGIGLNTAMFSAIYALGFSPRRLPEPDRLVQLYTRDKKEPTRFRAFSYNTYRELGERRDLFTGVLAQKLALVAVGEGTEARRTLSTLVSANFFEVLGVPPARGRGFTAGEGTPGADAPVVVVSHVYWRNSGSRSDLVGSTVRINGRPYTIVGIAPEDFNGTLSVLGPDLFFPLGVFDSLAGDSGGLGCGEALAQKIANFNHNILVMRLLLHGLRISLFVHQADRNAAGGNHIQCRRILQRVDVVDHMHAGGNRRAHHFGFAGVNRERYRYTAQTFDDRQYALQFLAHADRLRAGAGGFSADVEDIRTLGDQLLRMGNRGIAPQMLATVREGIGRGIDDAHDERAGEVEAEGAAV